MLDKPLLLTVSEVATLLGTSRARVYKLIAEEAIRGIRIGSIWRIRTDSVVLFKGDPDWPRKLRG